MLFPRESLLQEAHAFLSRPGENQRKPFLRTLQGSPCSTLRCWGSPLPTTPSMLR